MKKGSTYLIFTMLLIVWYTVPATAQEQRDPYLWPFSKTSIWNMPIGSNANYKDAKFRDARHVGVDVQHIIKVSNSDPMTRVVESPGFGPGRCSGTQYLGFDLRVPHNFIVPDAGNSPYGNTPNSNFAMVQPDGEMVFQGVRISRCDAGGPLHLPTWYRYSNNRKMASIKGDGIKDNRGQGASGMSALGGTVRLGELINSQPIRHALKINPWAKRYVHYSKAVPGFKWPANAADNYAPTGYNPNADPDILMGTLFAIPRWVNENDLGLQTPAGKKLFYALKHFGMYFTEDAAWDVWDIIAQEGVREEFRQHYGYSMSSDIWKRELNTLMKALHIVTNNAPNNIGGGGTPLAPLAPDFGSNGGGPSPDLTNGIYEIRPAIGQGKVLDVHVVKGNGDNVQLWNDANNNNQRWQVTALPNGFYRISPTHALSMCLDVAEAGVQSGANVLVWNYKSSTNQQWKLIPNGNGYALEPRHISENNNAPRLRLAVAGSHANDGANLEMAVRNNSAAQRFIFQRVGNARLGNTNTQNLDFTVFSTLPGQISISGLKGTIHQAKAYSIAGQAYFIDIMNQNGHTATLHTNAPSGLKLLVVTMADGQTRQYKVMMK